jgi:hypothetical protein
MGGMNWKRPTAIKGTMHHAKTSFSTEIFAVAINTVVQYMALLQFSLLQFLSWICASRFRPSTRLKERSHSHRCRYPLKIRTKIFCNIVIFCMVSDAS